MQRVPKEILEHIFFQLSPADKLECMTVCRSWASIIEAYNLSHTVRLSTQKGANSLLATLYERPHLRSQVRHLIIDTKEPVEINMLIPLLHDLKVLHASSEQALYLNRYPNHQFWQRSIEYLSLKPNSLDFFAPLLKYPCPNLRALSLDVRNIRMDHFVSFLYQCPNITDLHLFHVALKFDLLDNIHLALKHLCSLKLEKINLCYSELPTATIEPASTLTRFHLSYNGNGCLGMEDYCMEYISFKYPNLTDLTFCLSDQQRATRYDTVLDERHKRAVSLLLKNIDNVQNLFLHHHIMPFDFTNMLIDHCHRLVELTVAVGKDHLIIGSVITAVNTMPRIKRLHLRNIQLEVLPTLVSSMVGLESLGLSFLCSTTTQAIGVYDVLELCPPKLKSLTLEDVILNCTTTNDVTEDIKAPRRTFTHDFIRQLKFSHVEFCEGVDEALNIIFPRTRSLVLYECRFHTMALVFNQFRLKHVEVTKNEFGSGTHLIIKNGSGEEKVYTVGYHESHHKTLRQCDAGQFPVYPPTKRVFQSMEEEIVPFLELTCIAARDVIVRF